LPSINWTVTPLALFAVNLHVLVEMKSCSLAGFVTQKPTGSAAPLSWALALRAKPRTAPIATQMAFLGQSNLAPFFNSQPSGDRARF
jgi:hypothetical protein